MGNYHITDECIGCTICAQKCPTDAILAVPYQIHEINQEKCTKCDICRQVCPHDTVEIVTYHYDKNLTTEGTEKEQSTQS